MRIESPKEDRRLLGFTLVELLVTVVVLTVIAAIAVPIFLNQQAKASAAAAQANLGVLASAIKTGYGLDSTPTVSGGVLSYVSEAGEQQVPLAGAVVGLTNATSWCVEQEGGGEQWVMDASLTTPQTGECEVNPQPPTNLVASAVNGSDDSVELSWDAPNAPLSMPGGPQLGVLSPLATILPTATYGTITYEIRRNGVLLKSTTNTFYTDTGLEPDTEYTYTIAAVNNRGGSTLVSVTVRTNPSPASGETLDTDFNGDLSFSSIRAVVELPNGNLLGGGASVPKLVEMTQTRGLVAKYWSVLGTYVALNSTVRALAIVDGKAVAGGEFTNGPTPYLVRLNADGTRDTTFTPPTLNGIVTTLLTQDDGKLLVGGNFTDVAEDPALDRLIRLEADGTLDTTFTPPPLNNTVNVIKATGGGKYFVGGAFTDSGYPRLVRVESNGARDTSYSNSANNVVYCITELTDGDLLLGSNTRIRRLNSDGTLDTSWADTAFSNQVFAVQPLSNGQFLVGGSGIFSGATGYYGRLNSDGTRDTEFTPPSGIASYVFDIKPDGDGYLIMGQFSNVGGDPNNDGIIRVN